MEQLKLLQEDFPARICQSQEKAQDSQEQEVAFGGNSTGHPDQARPRNLLRLEQLPHLGSSLQARKCHGWFGGIVQPS